MNLLVLTVPNLIMAPAYKGGLLKLCHCKLLLWIVISGMSCCSLSDQIILLCLTDSLLWSSFISLTNISFIKFLGLCFCVCLCICVLEGYRINQALIMYSVSSDTAGCVWLYPIGFLTVYVWCYITRHWYSVQLTPTHTIIVV